MKKTKEIIELEKKLAEAKKKEGFTRYNLVVDEDEGELSEIEVSEKTLSKFDKAEVIDAVGEIAEAFGYLNSTGETLESTRTGYWLKFLYLAGEPVNRFFNAFFEIGKKETPLLINSEIFIALLEKHESWIGKGAKKLSIQLKSAVIDESE